MGQQPLGIHGGTLYETGFGGTVATMRYYAILGSTIGYCKWGIGEQTCGKLMDITVVVDKNTLK